MVNVDQLKDLARQASAPGTPAPGTDVGPDKDGYDASINPYKKYSREGNAAGWLIQGFQRLLGRKPTANEIAKYLPAYMGSDPNISDISGGDALIAQLASSQTNPDSAKPKYGNVGDAFKNIAGRDPTQAELDHYGTLLSNGELDDYTLGQILQQLPEVSDRKNAAMREGLTGELQKGDERYFSESILPSIQSSFLKSGRSVDSSGYATALAQAAKSQNRDRESFLANLTAQQYGGSQSNARQDYMNNTARNYQQQDAFTNRLYDLQNYNTQKQAYGEYLARYGKRSSGMGKGLGSLAGMGLGALLAAPTGGMSVAAGAALGGAGGGTFGSFFD